jgi:hypothetical protein
LAATAAADRVEAPKLEPVPMADDGEGVFSGSGDAVSVLSADIESGRLEWVFNIAVDPRGRSELRIFRACIEERIRLQLTELKVNF